MSIKLSIHGPVDTKLFESAENIWANTKFGIEKSWWRAGKDIHREFNRQVLAKNKTGRLYIQSNKVGARRKRRASGPGQTPANRTGHYRRSFGFIVGKGGDAGQLTIGNSAEYALPLEVGTSRMKARPGLGNSIKASERNILRNLAQDIEDAL